MPTIHCNETEVSNYATCSILMKDRIESILLTDDYEFINNVSSRNLIFNRLYQKLPLLFINLTRLFFFRQTSEEIFTSEGVTQSCKALRDLTCSFNNEEDNTANDGATVDKISSFTPNTSIDKLSTPHHSTNWSRLCLSVEISHVVSALPTMTNLAL